MALLGGSSPLRPTPFNAVNLSFTDSFAYSAGNLDGQGPWLRTSTTGPVVVSAGVVRGVSGSNTKASAVGALASIDWTLPWSISLTISTGVPPTGELYELNGAGTGGIGTGAWVCVVDVFAATVTWNGRDGTTASHGLSAVAPGSRTFKVSYDGAGTITVALTGNTSWTTPAGSMAGVQTPSGGFGITSNAGQTAPTVAAYAAVFRSL